jgi:hypothetical protein
MRHQLQIKQVPYVWGEPPAIQTSWEIVCEQVERVELSFYEEGKWHDTWRQDRIRGLPERVKVDLALQTDQGQPLLFQATAGLRIPSDKAPRQARVL